MTNLLVILLVAVSTIGGAGWVAWAVTERARSAAADELETARRRRRRPEEQGWLERKRRRQLIVHLLDDTSIRGMVLEVSEDGLLLGAPEYLGENSVTLGGEVFVPRERVSFVQAPPRSG